MTALPDSAIIFADIEDAFAKLNVARDSPRDIRRAFSQFVDLSQKLTSAMRRDFSRLGKGKWHAASFDGWTTTTDLVKWLRNEDQHRDLIFVSVHERRHFPIPTTLPPGFHVEPGRTFVFEGTWVLDDQLLTTPPDGITSYEIDALTGKPTGRPMELLKIERIYLLQARSEEARAKIAAAGSADMHEIAASAFETLRKYYLFFRAQAEG